MVKWRNHRFTPKQAADPEFTDVWFHEDQLRLVGYAALDEDDQAAAGVGHARVLF